MKKVVLTFGLLSGAVFVANFLFLMPFGLSYETSEILGYTSMFFAFLLVFFGIRSYRDNVAGGTIAFGKAFRVGILITLISCVMCVAAWEVYFYNFNPDFMETYAKRVVAKKRAEGATPAEVAATEKKMADFAKLYKNPLVNVGISFLEVFPVGLVMTLLSAAILRRKEPRPGQGAAKAAALHILCP